MTACNLSVVKNTARGFSSGGECSASNLRFVLLYTEVAHWAVLAFSPGRRTVRFIGDDKSDFDPLSFSATSTFALHAVALD